MRSDLETWKEWHKFESILWNMQMEERTKVAEYEKRYVVQKRWNLKKIFDLILDLFLLFFDPIPVTKWE